MAAAVLLVSGLVLSGGAALAAEPAPTPLLAPKKPPPSCGELPRGSRAFKDCLAAQSRRDTPSGVQPTAKPAFSSR